MTQATRVNLHGSFYKSTSNQRLLMQKFYQATPQKQEQNKLYANHKYYGAFVDKQNSIFNKVRTVPSLTNCFEIKRIVSKRKKQLA